MKVKTKSFSTKSSQNHTGRQPKHIIPYTNISLTCAFDDISDVF